MEKRYYGIDYLRAISCIAIMAMHIMANNNYVINGFIYNELIPSFTNFVFLFMCISSFVMCLNYYEKTINGEVNWIDFYRKRYKRFLPFFLFLIIIDLVVNYSKESLFEAFIEITLLHGFVDKELTVIGVGWYLGTVFIFYLIFPYFCTLISSKRKS